MQSGLVANRCESIASLRRSAPSTALRAVMSKKIERLAGPLRVSTRTAVACTLSTRPSTARSWKSLTGRPSPSTIASSAARRSMTRRRIGPAGNSVTMCNPFIAAAFAKPNSRAAASLASNTVPRRCRNSGDGERVNSSR